MSARARLLAALLTAGCAGGPRPTPAGDGALARLRRSPVAQEVARAAPEAFAAFARDLDVAERAPDDQREAALRDAEVTLLWAQSVARLAVAAERTAAATARAEAAGEAARRAEQQTAVLEGELERAANERASRERAAAAQARQGPPSAERVAAAADLRQQAELLLAASRLLGADDAARGPAQAALVAAEARASASDALLLAGRAFQAAEAVIRAARATAPAMAGSPPLDDAALLRSMAETPDLDPHRDARGVIAVLRGLFTGSALVPTARSRLTPVANIVRGQQGGRVRVEVFVGGPARVALPRARSQAEALRAALVNLGVDANRLEAQGVVRVPGGARSDDRAELVLLSR
ncbi:MAG: hypothetical protein R3A48_26745 [Polyangiales bacterium]